MPPKKRQPPQKKQQLENNCFIALDVSDKGSNQAPSCYDQRYLDALANIFHVHSLCAAVIPESKNDHNWFFRLSYNTPSTGTKVIPELVTIVTTALNSLKKPETDINEVSKLLLYAYLVTNISLPGDLQKIILLQTSEEVSEKIKAFRHSIMQCGAKFKQGLQSKKPVDQDIALVLKQYDLILGCKGKIDNELYDNFLLRPMQDIIKLLSYFSRESVYAISINVINKEPSLYLDTDHAEINLAFYAFKHINKEQFNYIGISKLSCYPCYITLEELGYEVRGTHGLCFKGWNKQLALKAGIDIDHKMLEVVDNIRQKKQNLQEKSEAKKEIGESYNEEGDFTPLVLMRQYRKLSIDSDLEENSMLYILKGNKDEIIAKQESSYDSALLLEEMDRLLAGSNGEANTSHKD
jgi:hypothetical protein